MEEKAQTAILNALAKMVSDRFGNVTHHTKHCKKYEKRHLRIEKEEDNVLKKMHTAQIALQIDVDSAQLYVDRLEARDKSPPLTSKRVKLLGKQMALLEISRKELDARKRYLEML